VIETPHITHTNAKHTAVIRLIVPRAEIKSVWGPAIAEVMAAVSAQGVDPSGPVFSHHLKLDPDTFDFEVGIPVTTRLSATGRVTASQLPATTVAQTVYHGPYEGLGAAWSEFDEWISNGGFKPASNLWECYVAGPESNPDPSTWRTELNRPLID
jgi:effector-binding domain-containing protein